MFLEALSRCINLRTLDLFLDSLEQIDAARAAIEHLIRLPAPPPISEITFAVRFGWAPADEVSRALRDLHALDSLLCGLGQIRHVTIRPTTADVSASDAPARTSNSVQGGDIWRLLRVFPRLRERGLLRVEELTALSMSAREFHRESPI